MQVIKLRDDFIKLGQAIKAAGLVESGVEAKIVIQDGEVKVNGAVETQRGTVVPAAALGLFFDFPYSIPCRKAGRKPCQ